MRKIMINVLLAVALAACSDEMLLAPEELSGSEPDKRNCAAMDMLAIDLARDPQLKGRMEAIEEHVEAFVRARKNGRINYSGKIEIPVVVNVIYKTATQNISQAQIDSQIDVLNEDFNKTNTDASSIPGIFTGVASDLDIQFVLFQINRKSATPTSWLYTANNMKKTAQGGLDPVAPASMLNIWVVNKIVDGAAQEILGYGQFPGGSSTTDGVVVGYKWFGRTGTATSPFNKGRTATHEVGHYLNLIHIWGDAYCGSDLVSDTPAHDAENFNCPSFPTASLCSGSPTEMTMNFMDYTDDACMYMFTDGQKARVLANFIPGGPRNTLGPIDMPYGMSNSGSYPWTFYWYAPTYTGPGIAGYEVKHIRYDYSGNPNPSSVTFQTGLSYVLPYTPGQYSGQGAVVYVRTQFNDGSFSGWNSFNCTL